MTPPFGSTLSARGFLALRDAGFRPLRQVQGTSILSLGLQPLPNVRVSRSLRPSRLEGIYGSTEVYFPRGSLTVGQYLNEGGWTELEQRTSAYNDARTQALKRLRSAAREAGAMAVVDLRIRRGKFAPARHAIEFTALGAAVGADRFELEGYEEIRL